MAKRSWYKLDNSAKIMPSTTTNLNTNVFRLVCTLKEEIDSKILQEALDKTLIEFPLFLYTMKYGLFWHYLEPSDYKPLVTEEKEPVCARIDNGFLFRVTYFQKRVNLEVYHVLADGNGAMEFLKYLICTYLNKKYELDLHIPINDSSTFQKEKDDFKTFDKSKFKINVSKEKNAYRIKLPKKDNIHHDVIELQMDVTELKKAAKKYGVTLAVYLTAVLIKSIIENAAVKDLKRPIGITLPVDLRNFFPSKTVRNFFYTILVSYKAKENNSLENITKEIAVQLKEQTTKEALQEKINGFMLTEKILFIRVIPNFIKDFALRYIAKLAKKSQTTVLSNLGIAKFPKAYEEYIDSLSVIASTDDIQLTVISFKDKITLAFSSHFVNKEIERQFLKEIQKEVTSDIKVISNIGSDTNE